ncbi:helix-turn-helix transcriptional regulator [Natrarchaeobius chitinivorans]|uniref:helix-turn-helix transcriptional regulator n=1 Tax=Natrarchaeobius chitinivorans TaxID=1679083 RepID=UPI001FB4B118|nr:hypothetical protein [Natrarchaeobius chitinivorans]
MADVDTGSVASQESTNESEQQADEDDAVNETDQDDGNEGEETDGSENDQSDDNESDGTDEWGLNESDQLDNADEVHIDVFLHENRSATFVVDYRFENASTTDWENLQADVEANPEGYAEKERADWSTTVEAGQNRTDREMDISNVRVETDTSSAPRNLGHVEFTFEWSAFSHRELNRIEAGDALAGFTLVDDTTLQFFWPDGYTVREVDPSPDDPPEDSIFWDGDGTEFTDDQPLIVLIEDGGQNDEPTDPEESPAMPWFAVIGALSLLVLAAAVGWLIRHRADGGSDSTGWGSSGPPPRSVGPNGGATDSGDPPAELLSNEERVLRLLEQRGGRIKQQAVVSELEWTEAKTSQVVSGLREDDEIEVFRIGRENVLSLPEEDESA